jgi:hypothetical protein
MKRYAVVFDLQEAEIKKYCFGLCGKILVGAIAVSAMHCMACNESDCPYLERQVDEVSFTDNRGNDYYLRKLKESEEE